MRLGNGPTKQMSLLLGGGRVAEQRRVTTDLLYDNYVPGREMSGGGPVRQSGATTHSRQDEKCCHETQVYWGPHTSEVPHGCVPIKFP